MLIRLLDILLRSKQANVPFLQIQTLGTNQRKGGLALKQLLLEQFAFPACVLKVQVEFGHLVRQLKGEPDRLVAVVSQLLSLVLEPVLLPERRLKLLL